MLRDIKLTLTKALTTPTVAPPPHSHETERNTSQHMTRQPFLQPSEPAVTVVYPHRLTCHPDSAYRIPCHPSPPTHEPFVIHRQPTHAILPCMVSKTAFFIQCSDIGISFLMFLSATSRSLIIKEQKAKFKQSGNFRKSQLH